MSHIDLQESTGGASSSHHTATYISMGSSNFISAAVLDISRKATAVKERADLLVYCIPVLQDNRVSPYAGTFDMPTSY